MNIVAKRVLSLLVVVTIFMGIFNEHLLAGDRAGIVVIRLYTGTDGMTHAEEILQTLARGEAFTDVSKMEKATGVQFRRQDPHYFEDWHNAPRKQYVLTLSGRGEIELKSGKKIQLGP